MEMENIFKLAMKYRDDEDVITMIKEALKNFTAYVKIISDEEIFVTTEKSSLDTKEFREKVVALDRKRRSIHNTLINDVKLFNRLSEINGLKPFYDGSDAREEIGMVAFEWVQATFKRRYRR